MSTIALYAASTPRPMNPNSGEPIALGVCAEIARSLHVPTGQVRLVAAAMIIGSLVVPGLIAYGVLGYVFHSRRRFARSHPANPALARANSVLDAYIGERRTTR
jgi:phage shock protein PspC (stress-responsive transcriptional regulator)